MKKFLTLLSTIAVACALSMPVFAQDTGAGKTEAAGKKEHKGGKKGHKGGKKSKKGSADSGTSTPK